MTRQRLLDIAIAHFAQLGFDGASTRDMAGACGTAMSSITYHFGGKRGLYLAAAEHISDSIQAIQQPMMDSITAHPATSPGEAMEQLCELSESFARMMVLPRAAPWASFIIREQQQPTEAFDIIYERVMQPLLTLCLRLAGQARPDLPETTLRVLVLGFAGQAIVLRAAREAACRMMQVDTLDGPAIEIIVAQIKTNIRTIFRAEHPGAPLPSLQE